MVDFLLQDGVIESLLGFVTQLNAGPRPTSSAAASEALILSYKTTVLLTAEVPSNELMSVLGRKVSQIAKASFDVCDYFCYSKLLFLFIFTKSFIF